MRETIGRKSGSKSRQRDVKQAPQLVGIWDHHFDFSCPFFPIFFGSGHDVALHSESISSASHLVRSTDNVNIGNDRDQESRVQWCSCQLPVPPSGSFGVPCHPFDVDLGETWKCRVFAGDPSTTHPFKLSPVVTFHNVGLMIMLQSNVEQRSAPED